MVTGDIFNTLQFGSVNSGDYGIYITGEAVYNAPVRAVELVSVPNRNGAVAIDQGYWENIEITYPAGCFAENQSDFASAISAFRNAIVSQIGYQRLIDTYHPEQYRMAMYVSGLEVAPVQSGKAGEFELKFNCKPQRWLVTGENEITVSNNDIIVNPTLYDASPLLAVDGYGTIGFNGYEIEIDNAVYGDIEVSSNKSGKNTSPVTQSFNTDLYNSGDTLTCGKTTFIATFKLGTSGRSVRSVSNSSHTGNTTSGTSILSSGVQFSIHQPSFSVASTSTATESDTRTVTMNVLDTSAITQTVTLTITTTVSYASDTVTASVALGSSDDTLLKSNSYTIIIYAASADSTVSILGTPTYIDCDLGVCYKIESDNVIDLNGYIDLGSDLPTLASGSNTVTHDNTVTDLKITPRWWQL